MDLSKPESCYEFLDLEDANEAVRKELKESLFGGHCPEHLQFPWIPSTQHFSANGQNQQWQQHPQYDDDTTGNYNGNVITNGVGSTSGASDTMSGTVSPHSHSSGSIPPAHSPTAYSAHNQHMPFYAQAAPYPQVGPPQHSQNVFVSNVTANVNVHGYVPRHYIQPTAQQHPQEQDNTNRNNARRNNRPRQRTTPTMDSPSAGVPQPYQYVSMPTYATAPYYTQPPPHGTHPSAGSPLYITPIYHPAPHVYSPYPPHGTFFYPPSGMQVNTEYQFAADVHGPPLHQEAPVEINGNVQPNFENENAPPVQPSHNVMTTVIVNSNLEPQMQSTKKPSKSVLNTQVSIKQNVRPETFDVGIPETVTVTTPVVSNKVVNVTATANIEKSHVEVTPATNGIKEPVVVNGSLVDTTLVNVIETKPKKNIVSEEKLIIQFGTVDVEEMNKVTIEKQKIVSSVPNACNNKTTESVVCKDEEIKKIDIPVPVKTNDVILTHKIECKTTNTEPKSSPIVTKDEETETPQTDNTSPPGKSWASLFSKNETNINNLNKNPATPKPLARVSPMNTTQPEKVESTVEKVKGTVSEKKEQKKPSLPKQVNCKFLEDPNAYRMGEFLCSYSIDNRTVSLLPRGLANRSNYCYVNSILQALLACPPFYNLIRAIPLQYTNKINEEKSTTPIIRSLIEFVNEFSPLPAGARVGRREKSTTTKEGQKEREGFEIVNCGPSLDPACVYRSMHAVCSDAFTVEGRQEDAEEFLGCLLNGLNDEMVELLKLVGDTTQTQSNRNVVQNGSVDIDDDEDEWKVMGPKNKGSITRCTEFGRSPISDIFRGQLRSRVQRAGDQSTDNVQPFFTLQLDIEKTSSVKEALELLAGRDRLEGVTCSRTQQAVEAWQQVSLEQLPYVLILHLKCFLYEQDTCTKIIKNVEFPIDLKIDAKLMSSKNKYTNKQKQYKLFAVVYHDGNKATKGHYITDAYHVGYGGWVRYDDASVRGVTEAQVLKPKAPRMPYLLYYRRCDTIGNQGAQQSKKE